ncbi:hypothetical protein BD770DRAFT_383275 [Pilaira anomala]|nr:hypothetical protein BD770DRAFT_383275 [Pilaira anomala]
MDSVKPKRFSFAGFSSGLSRSLSFTSGTKLKKEEISTNTVENHPVATTTDETEEITEAERKLKRAQKSKSLYIKSFHKKAPTQYDASEATQKNSKEIRSSIRRSLSAVLYASPHSTDDDEKSYSSKLVPVLVTPELSDSVGGFLIDDGSKNKIKNNEQGMTVTEEKKKKKNAMEYDNSLEVFPTKDGDTTIIWQGYGYTITPEQEEVRSELDKVDLETFFEKNVWDTYRGLIHPLHLFQEEDEQEIVKRGRWAGLTVTELRRYFDNYGSMLLKIRESRMLEQQRHYQHLLNVKNEWIIPDIVKD